MMREIMFADRIIESLKKRDHLEDLGVDERETLKLALKKYFRKVVD
jgi:hypothetical protein